MSNESYVSPWGFEKLNKQGLDKVAGAELPNPRQLKPCVWPKMYVCRILLGHLNARIVFTQCVRLEIPSFRTLL